MYARKDPAPIDDTKHYDPPALAWQGQAGRSLKHPTFPNIGCIIINEAPSIPLFDTLHFYSPILSLHNLPDHRLF